MHFKKKVAVVTGGTRGLGKAISEMFLEEGATVVCASRSRGEIEDLLVRHGDRVVYEYADVTEVSTIEKMAKRTVERHGVPHILVSNAGVSRDAKVLATDPGDWRSVINTNVNGVFNATHVMAPLMVDAGIGCIINMSSVMGSRPATGAASYCASKAAIDMFTRVSALELGSKGIRVNALAPGFFDTGMGSRLMENSKAWESYGAKIAMRRPGSAAELARAAAFLASDECSYINGHVLEVNGGLRWS